MTGNSVPRPSAVLLLRGGDRTGVWLRRARLPSVQPQTSQGPGPLILEAIQQARHSTGGGVARGLCRGSCRDLLPHCKNATAL